MKYLALIVGLTSAVWFWRRPKRFPASSASRKPAGPFEVFRSNQLPRNAFKEIAVLSDDGHPFEHTDIEADFIKKAKAMGGDAVVLLPPVKSIEAPAGWQIFDTFRYLAAVVVYEKSVPQRA